MDVLQAFLEAVQYFGHVNFLLAMAAGTIVGMIMGVIPGLGGTIALALCLPFVFGTPPELALPFMIAIWGTTATTGAITSILLNVPGTTVNVVTLIDGYPMTQKGEAGRALGAALTSSAAGGAVTAVLALALIPLVLPMVLAVQSADMVFMILLGIALIAVLSRGSMVKGLISGAFGLLLSFVGYDHATGLARFSLGTSYLFDGIGLVPLALGLYALPEMVKLSMVGGTIAKAGAVIGGMEHVWEGVKDVFRRWKLWLRCSVAGFLIGVIPGVGAVTATFMAYAHAKQSSKNPEEFGKGAVEGVIAPESANNAKDGGALLTTLALGIPGGSDEALLIGAFLLLGLIPGPTMLRDNLPIALNMLYVLIVSNLAAAGICFLAIRHLVKVALIPARLLSPAIIVMALIAAFAVREIFHDITLTLVMGVVGLALIRFGFNRAPVVLGFVLGSLFERYLLLAYRAGGPLFFMRPISLSLIFLLIAAFLYKPVKNWIWHRRGAEAR